MTNMGGCYSYSRSLQCPPVFQYQYRYPFLQLPVPYRYLFIFAIADYPKQRTLSYCGKYYLQSSEKPKYYINFGRT